MELNSICIAGIQILVFRDDLNHATVSGNKLHKLTPNIALAKSRNCSTILSFGGPHSNHLHALAWAGRDAGLSTIGIVRGELHRNLTPTLRDCQNWGMRLRPSLRSDYRKYQEILSLHNEPCLASEIAIQPLSDLPQNTLILPEGGSNIIAIKSISEAYRKIFSASECRHITHAVCATGTGATLSGLRIAAPSHIEVIGVQVVAEGNATRNRIHNWIEQQSQSLRIKEGHLGGFGKMPVELLEFIREFEAAYNIPLDPVYNGKAMFKILKMITEGYFEQGNRILFIHTGGLQGKRSNT